MKVDTEGPALAAYSGKGVLTHEGLMNEEQSAPDEPASMHGGDAEYATREEVIEAIGALSDLEHQKLGLISRFWHGQRQLFRLGVEADELLSEAYVSTLSGRRKWRKARVTLVKHLDESMRSISGHCLEKARTITAGKRDVQGLARVHEQRTRPIVLDPSTEARIGLEAIRAAFSDDPSALRVLECRAEGMTAEEARLHLSLTKTDYETITRRILRKFVKYALKG